MPDNLWSYSRDQQKSVPDTLLVKGSKNPDRWRKMNASFTKYTFKPDTLYHTVIFLADKLVKLVGFDMAKQDIILVMEKRGLEAKLILKYVDVMKQKVKEGTLPTWKQNWTLNKKSSWTCSC